MVQRATSTPSRFRAAWIFRTPVDAEIRPVDDTDVFDQLRVPDSPRRRWAGLGGVVGARGDLHPSVREDTADRLDPEPVAVLVDVLDEHRSRHRGYFSLRSSSAAPKKADAVFRIGGFNRSAQ
jgi:hypothetical protein